MTARQEKLERKATRLHYQPWDGPGVMAAQYYDDANSPANLDPERYMIYVAWEGQEGRPLNEVLRELDAYKRAFGEPKVLERVASLQGDIHAQMNMIQVANQRITALEKRRRFWPFGSAKR